MLNQLKRKHTRTKLGLDMDCFGRIPTEDRQQYKVLLYCLRSRYSSNPSRPNLQKKYSLHFITGNFFFRLLWLKKQKYPSRPLSGEATSDSSNTILAYIQKQELSDSKYLFIDSAMFVVLLLTYGLLKKECYKLKTCINTTPNLLSNQT